MTGQFEQITSLQKTRVKLARKLLDKRDREQSRLFVIEYVRDLSRALDSDYVPQFTFYCPELATHEDSQILDRLKQGDIFEVSGDVMQKASYRQNPTGILAVMHMKPDQPLSALDPQSVETGLVLVDLGKPGNIGALLRTADAAGMQAVVLVDTSLDRYNPNVIRSSTGAVFLPNIFYASSKEALQYLKEQGFTIIAAVVDGDRSMFEITIPERSVIVLGTEDIGLDEIWSQAATFRVRIPMAGTVADSLNVSVSGAILMYESLRQRLSPDFNF